MGWEVNTMSVLITGGGGYIGTHTCIEMLQAGYDIVVVDNFSNSKPEAIKRVREMMGKDFPVYNLDILNKAGLERIFQENDIEAVIHFAGFKAVGESVEKPLLYYENNIIGMINLCGVMEKYAVNHLVFSSSATVYSPKSCVPFNEEMPLLATNPYGRTKIICEQLLNDVYAANHNWSIALLRYFNPVGAHQSGLIGEDPNGIPNNLLPFISQVASGELEELKIFGDTYRTDDGTGVRDYIHVMDLANGHVKALEHIFQTTGIEAYNLGRGKGRSVLEMIDAFEKASGKQIPYQIVERRAGDIAISYADPMKAKRELNWTAKRGINEMCMDTWRFQVNNPKGYEESEEEDSFFSTIIRQNS